MTTPRTWHVTKSGGNYQFDLNGEGTTLVSIDATAIALGGRGLVDRELSRALCVDKPT